jgi:predicted aspartyl protease
MSPTKRPKIGAAWAEHIFLDVVGYSRRTIESQTSIINILNRIVGESVKDHQLGSDRTIYIPTGDGMCISLLNVPHPYDIQIRIALGILERLHKYNSSAKTELAFEVRVGINANRDNVVIDINGNCNVAGAGINEASRIMNKADGGQILVGDSVFDTLRRHDEYLSAFRPYSATVKHGLLLQLHQLVAGNYAYLNTNVPSAFATPADIEVESATHSDAIAGALRAGGLKLRVEIAASADDAKVAQSAGIPTRPLTITALIDTGASVTVINPQVALTCALRRTGTVNISTVGQVAQAIEYVAALRFPGSDLKALDPVRVIAGPLPAADVACIIGRDILQHWRLIYDGRTGKVEIRE